MRQPAEIGGVPLLTFALVTVNLLVWRVWVLRARSNGSWRPRLAHAIAAAAIVVAGAGYGQLRLGALRTAMDDADRMLRVGVVQGSVDNAVRLAWARGDDRAAEEQLRPYMLLTEELRTSEAMLDLVVWPEAAYPGVFRRPATTLQRGRANKFDRQVLRLGLPIVFGAYDMEGDAERATFFNALFAVTPRYDRPGSLGEVSRYRKHLLLPFAETLPGPLDGQWIRDRLPSLARFGRGAGAEVFAIELPSRDRVRLGPIICSESLSSSHVAAGVRAGAQLILNVGSDGWFGSFGEPAFHLAISRMRSVETRRTQIRAANTGISALILPDGSVPTRSAIGERTALVIEAPILEPRDTLVVRWGAWFAPAALAAGVPWLAALLWRARTEVRRIEASAGDV
jgi:apolipoprotein N-acyltransferase